MAKWKSTFEALKKSGKSVEDMTTTLNMFLDAGLIDEVEHTEILAVINNV